MRRITIQKGEIVKKGVILLLTLAFLIIMAVQAWALEGVPTYVQTPQSMVKWFQNDFTYAWTIPFSKKSAQEMVEQKTGACYDFAVLASEVLSKLNISNSVVLIKFQGTSIGHAICVWQAEDGTYNFITNKKIVYTGEKNINEAVMKYYPDTERIIIDGQKSL